MSKSTRKWEHEVRSKWDMVHKDKAHKKEKYRTRWTEELDEQEEEPNDYRYCRTDQEPT